MDLTAHILRNFGNLDRNSDLPVCKQLEANIARFIASNPSNTYFPSGRELSRVLGLHRKTVANALKPFFQSGQLKKNGKGIFTSREKLSDEEVHELNFALFPSSSMQKRELRILSYENSPFQRKMWQDIACWYEAGRSRTLVNIDFRYPRSMEWKHELPEYLADSDYDAVQLPVLYLWDAKLADRFEPLSENFRKLLESPRFRTKQIMSNCPAGLLAHLYPVNFGCRFCSCNLDLLEKAGIRKPPADFYELIRQLSAKDSLPAYLCNHFYNLLYCASLYADQHKNIQFILSLFHGRNPDTGRFFRTPMEQRERFLLDIFLDGQVIIGQNGSGYTLKKMTAEAKFPIRHYLPLPQNGGCSLFSSNLFAIPGRGRNKELAEDFLAALYEPFPQNTFADYGMIPARISSDSHFVKLLGGTISLKEFRHFASLGKEELFRDPELYRKNAEIYHSLCSQLKAE